MFGDLVNLRWAEALRSVGLPPTPLTWEVSDDYPHFKKKRGYAVCFFNGSDRCHLKFSSKILKAPFHRADALLRHEISHALDFLLESNSLNRWALQTGIKLPPTPERRADALALAIWREPILYDQDLVQSTRYGTPVRPKHLGL